ncbi:LOW QUALITY PROTEIN: formin-like protein 5 [Cucurbita maxima]|uniref:Formin-like protein n=1 Tax=Cucurbita maxima TaxID=3661 RepID=A0A6J1IM15_CUCMA|nr:LOW QUALITY PROTEIN: formin-like protein 5 [Cucurbita maxima]
MSGADERKNKQNAKRHASPDEANSFRLFKKEFHVSGNDYNSKAWYPTYLESLFLMPGSFRRKLSSRWHRSAKEVSKSSDLEHLSIKLSSTSSQKEKKSDHQQTIIIAVVVTATVTFIIVALLFICYNSISSRMKQNDENHARPLLSLSINSSPNFSAFGNSFKEDKYMNQASSLSQHQRAPSLDGSLQLVSDGARISMQGPPSFEAAGIVNNSSFGSVNLAGSSNNLLPPPPGAVPVNSEIMPPLKPPPGRAVPLPPERPKSFKPPSSMATPPPPPPPAPPPELPGDSGHPPGPPGNSGLPPVPPGSSGLPPVPPGNSGLPPVPPGSSGLPPVPPGNSAVPPVPPGNSGRPSGPPPPPPPGANRAGPRPPPPPGSGNAPRPPPFAPKGGNAPRPPRGSALGGDNGMEDSGVPKAKLKPFFWDKVLANPDNTMVWHQIKAGSFQFNEEMIETLFGYAPADKNKTDGKKEPSSKDPVQQFIQIIDAKKAQNLSILLRALNVTREEVCDALHEGTDLPAELLENLLRMAPTPEEELKLRLFSGETSQLGNAERFLKTIVDIPFAFKRMESLLFMSTIQEDIAITKESFVNLEIACKELKSSRLFLKLLEAVLKTGNRMNDGTFRGGAQAFKLDTLLKLSDVKGKDGKTTLLHFVVQEIIRTEGIRAARNATGSQSFSSTSSKEMLDGTTHDPDEHFRNLGLEVVSGLSGELQNVKKAATIDADALTGTVSKLGHGLLSSRDFLNKDMENLGEESRFHQTLKSFVQNAEVTIMALLAEEKKIMEMVKSTGDYFHGNAGKDEGLRLFVIVRDFLIMIDKTCREIKDAQKKQAKQAKGHRKAASSSDINPSLPSSDTNQPPSSSSDTNQPPSSSQDTNQTTSTSQDTNQTTSSSPDTNQPPSSSSDTNQPPSSSSDTNQPPSSSSDTNQPTSSSQDTNQTTSSSQDTNQTTSLSQDTNPPMSSSQDTNPPPSSSPDANQPPSAPVSDPRHPPPPPSSSSDINQPPSAPASGPPHPPPPPSSSSYTNQPPSAPISYPRHPPPPSSSSDTNQPPSAPVSDPRHPPPPPSSSSDTNQPPSAPVSGPPHPPPPPSSSYTNQPPSAPVSDPRHPPPNLNQLIFPAITDRRMGSSSSSSDDESP